MITFILGVSAAAVVGILVWSVNEIKKADKQIKSIMEEKRQIWSEIENRCNSIERSLFDIERELNKKVDDNYSYTDSRFDKFANAIERNYVSKTDNASNTISYNN
jgi:hypothetical protein